MMRRALQIFVGGAALASLVALSNWDFPEESSKTAMLRLSWRAIGRELERCRALSAEEQGLLEGFKRETESGAST